MSSCGGFTFHLLSIRLQGLVEAYSAPRIEDRGWRVKGGGWRVEDGGRKRPVEACGPIPNSKGKH